MRALLVVCSCLLPTACALVRRAPSPMPSTYFAAAPGSRSEVLLVLLPGRYNRARDFERHGFVNVARDADAPIDLVAVDARLGHYERGTFAERLSADVFAEAGRRGYDSIWLVGISLGGFGALRYGVRHPAEVEGVLAIAPFLGDDDVIEEIESRGSLARWARVTSPERGDEVRELWVWLDRCARAAATCPRIHLAFGDEDRFARAHRLLAAVLPRERVLEVSGGHDWATWRELFAASLPSMLPSAE